MQRGVGRSIWCLSLLFLATGCITLRNDVEKKLIAGPNHKPPQAVGEHYQVGCPDILRIEVAKRPALSGDYIVGPEGRIRLREYGPIRIDGRTPPEIAQQLADETGAAADEVRVEVIDYRSQYLVLFGQVIGWQRVVPYRGQETVLDVLQRTGGITRGAAPDHVFVVRTHVEDGNRPEVFHVDLAAIVMKNDERTNVRLMPFDQIYVGETRQSRIERAMPPILRPLYQTFWDTMPATPESREPMSRTPRPRWWELLPGSKPAPQPATSPPSVSPPTAS